MKRKIDKFFTENYDKLIEITSARIIKTGRDIDAVTVVSNAYEYLLSNKELTEDKIECWCISYIYYELALNKSKTMYNHNKYNENTDNIDDHHDIGVECDLIQMVDNNIFLEGFVNTLDRFNLIIWEVYYSKGKRSSGELAEHFGFSRTEGWNRKKELLNKLKEYAKSENRI